MGLDQYAYAAAKARARDDWYEDAEYDKDAGEYVNRGKTKPIELAYWRKHANLQGWMEALWVEKGKPMTDGSEPPEPSDWGTGFNGIELELTTEDIDRLEQAILNGELPPTKGFFFGEGADDYYRDQDLQFVREARANLFLSLRVFYNSSW
jgi:hypothetical protein